MNASPRFAAHSFVRRAMIVIGLVTAVVLLVIFAWQIMDVLLLLFGGIMVGVFLSGISGWIRGHTRLSHRQSLAITLAALLAVLVLAGVLAVPNLIAQGDQLAVDLQESLQSLETMLSNQEWARPLMDRLSAWQQSGSSTSSLMSRVSGLFSRTFGLLTNMVVIFFVGIYLALEPTLYANGLIRLVPQSHRGLAGRVLDEVAYTLRWWLAGRLASMVIVGVLSTAGLYLLGIPLAFILGVLAGLLAFIPIIGPALALIPPLLIAAATGFTGALYVLLLYLGIQVVESYLITPLIQRKTVDLPPALLILSQVTFGLFFNLLGLAVAAPAAAMILSLTKMLYVKGLLGDEEVELLKEDPVSRFAASTVSS